MIGKKGSDPVLFDDEKMRKRCDEDIESTKRRTARLRRRLEKLPLRQGHHRTRHHGLERIRRGFRLSRRRCRDPAAFGAGGRTERLSARANLCRAFRGYPPRRRRRRSPSAWRDRKRTARREGKTARSALLRIAGRKNSRPHSGLLVALRHLAHQSSRLVQAAPHRSRRRAGDRQRSPGKEVIRAENQHLYL